MINQKINKLGYGCYSLGGVYGKELSEKEIEGILKKTYDLGIKFFDTSSNYGNTEEILGNVVKDFRKDIVLSTKVSVNDYGKVDLTYQNVITSCDKSLKKLKTDYIDILHLHYNDSKVPVEETVAALEKLKKIGKILNYGIGHFPQNVMRNYLEIGNISTVMAEINPINYNKLKDLKFLQQKYSFDIIAYSITGRGIFTGKITSNSQFTDNDIRKIDPMFRNKKLEYGLNIVKKLKEVGSQYSMTPVQVAINWTLQNKGVIFGLTGTTNLCHLKENLDSLNTQIGQDYIKEIDDYLERQHERLKKEQQEEVEKILTLSSKKSPAS